MIYTNPRVLLDKEGMILLTNDHINLIFSWVMVHPGKYAQRLFGAHDALSKSGFAQAFTMSISLQ